MASFFLVLECLNEIWAKFDFFAPTMLLYDRQGRKHGQFDDSLTHKNSIYYCFTTVSLSAIEWSTHSVFTALAWKKVEIWGPNQRMLMRDPAKLISLLSSPLGRHWERDQLSPHEWRARKFLSCNLCFTRLPVRSYVGGIGVKKTIPATKVLLTGRRDHTTWPKDVWCD